MNKPRRKHIDEVIEQLTILQNEIDEIFEEEDGYKENMPENLWNSERYNKAEEACEYLEDARDNLDDIIGSLEEAKG